MLGKALPGFIVPVNATAKMGQRKCQSLSKELGQHDLVRREIALYIFSDLVLQQNGQIVKENLCRSLPFSFLNFVLENCFGEIKTRF